MPNMSSSPPSSSSAKPLLHVVVDRVAGSNAETASAADESPREGATVHAAQERPKDDNASTCSARAIDRKDDGMPRSTGGAADWEKTLDTLDDEVRNVRLRDRLQSIHPRRRSVDTNTSTTVATAASTSTSTVNAGGPTLSGSSSIDELEQDSSLLSSLRGGSDRSLNTAPPGGPRTGVDGGDAGRPVARRWSLAQSGRQPSSSSLRRRHSICFSAACPVNPSASASTSTERRGSMSSIITECHPLGLGFEFDGLDDSSSDDDSDDGSDATSVTSASSTNDNACRDGE